MVMEHLALITQLLVGQKPIRYSRHRNRCHIDMDWDTVNVGEYLLIRGYEVVDPEQFIDVYKDQWLLRYATALIKQQWGANLTKFTGMQLPGGVMFNGQKIYDDATAEIERMRLEMINTYSLPVLDMIG
jgi:hypothetical protein